MTNTLSKQNPQASNSDVKVPEKETVFTPRFYTTDFDAMAAMDLSSQEDELRAVLEELRADYNRDHFHRDEQFQQSWDHLDPETRQTFIEFLERSCTSEFSGFLLFKELSRRLKDRNPLLAEAFHLLARDEARHSGFLNKCMSDFNLSLDLRNMTKTRKYTFFKPEWVIYAVYLSEKIGYWRYITIYRHLEKHPEWRFYPLFSYFKRWCQDENRHGDFFNALLRSQGKLYNNWKARLWARFFLLTVFVTHSVTVHERDKFYTSVGLDPTEFDRHVIRKTNETSARAFPVILDVDHPQFFPRIHKCCTLNQKMAAIDQSNRPKAIKWLQKLPLGASMLGHVVRMYLIKPIYVEPQRGIAK